MNIEDFDFAIKQLSPGIIECLLINKESKIRFGTIIRGNGIPPNNWVFERFLEDRRLQNFFIDIDSEIIYDGNTIEKKEVVSMEINAELKNIEKSEKSG